MKSCWDEIKIYIYIKFSSISSGIGRPTSLEKCHGNSSPVKFMWYDPKQFLVKKKKKKKGNARKQTRGMCENILGIY